MPTHSGHQFSGGAGLSAADWDTVFNGRAWGRWPHEGVVRAFAGVSGQRRDLRVLDVGCGPGAHLAFVETEGHRGWGVDISEVAISQAAARLATERRVPRLTRCGATSLPFATGSFDVVLDVEVFTYLGADRADAWREAARVLAPAGSLISVGFGLRCDPELREYLRHCDPLTETEISALADGAGLAVIDQQVYMRTQGPGHRWIEEIVTVAQLR